VPRAISAFPFIKAARRRFRMTGKVYDDLKKGKDSPYSITERPLLGSQPAGDVSHKPGGKLPLLSARPAVTPRNP